MADVFIGRQPILDRNMNVFAYELKFHMGLNPNNETIAATEQLLKKTEQEIGFSQIVGGHSAMMQLPKELIKLSSLPSVDEGQNIVLEIPNNVSKDAEVLRNLKELKTNGKALSLDNFIDDESSVKLASISEFAKINADNFSEIKLKGMLDSLHAKGLKVIAQKVQTEEMFNYLKGLGFDYFQGYFFTNPVMINGEKLSGNKMTLLQLMAKINSPDTDFTELAEILSQDVALSHKLLIAVNNPATMIPVEVESVRDALKYMGLKRLKFWINMLLLSSMDDVPQELLTSSLIRAHFCENLAQKAGMGRDKDSFFLVGLFSNLGAFFKLPIADIVKEMPLSQELKSALVEKTGPMGEAIKIFQALERADNTLSKVEFQGLGITDIGHVFMQSSAWAQQAIAA